MRTAYCIRVLKEQAIGYQVRFCFRVGRRSFAWELSVVVEGVRG
jgi:hypothetical protein